MTSRPSHHGGRPRAVVALLVVALFTALLAGSPAARSPVPEPVAPAGPPVAAYDRAGPAGGAGSASPTLLPSPPTPRRDPQPAGQATRPGHEAHEQLRPLRAERAWWHADGDEVVVAVLDSGVDAGHPDLAGRVLPGRDLVDGDGDARTDPVGHGTTVASMVAGGGDPAVGLAPAATILPVRVLDRHNRYEHADTVAEGVRWAVDHGADVINLSLGGPRESRALADALSYAMAHDVVVVACTGNTPDGSDDEVWYPAREPGVVAVAGLSFIDGEPVRWPSSLTGPQTVLAAPAVVTGAKAGGGHRRVQGTSFSSALVAGAAALIRDYRPELSAADVVHRLISTADDRRPGGGFDGRHPEYGFGMVDPVAALTDPVPPVAANPIDTRADDGESGLGTAPEHTREPGHPPTSPTPPAVADGAPAGGDPGGLPAPVTGPPAAGTWVVLGTVIAALAGAAHLRFRRRS